MLEEKKSIFINLLIIGIAGFFFLAVLMLYKSNAKLSLQYYNVLFFVLSSLTLFYLLILGWSLENKYRVLLTSISFFIGILLIELTLTLIPNHYDNKHVAKRAQVAQKLGIEFDSRNRIEIYTSEQNKGNQVWPNLSPEYLVESNGIVSKKGRLFPLSAGISNVNTMLCNESGKFVTYNSDELGFNNPKGLITRESIDEVVLGDSYVHGACVPQGQDLPSALRSLSKKTILNLGSCGVGPLVELAMLTEFAQPLRPKKVFWVYFEGNDLEDLAFESKSSFLLNYLNDNFSQNLRTRTSELDELIKEYIIDQKTFFINLHKPKDHKSILGIFKLQKLRSKFDLNAVKSEDLSIQFGLFEAILATAKRRVNTWGGELIFVYLPDYDRLTSKSLINNRDFKHKAIVEDLLKKNHINYIDATEVFKDHSDPMSFYPMRIYGHFNDSGYRLVAKFLQNSIESGPL